MSDKDYRVSLFEEKDFERRKCPKCGTWFWTLGEHLTCGDWWYELNYGCGRAAGFPASSNASSKVVNTVSFWVVNPLT